MKRFIAWARKHRHIFRIHESYGTLYGRERHYVCRCGDQLFEPGGRRYSPNRAEEDA